MSLIYQSDAHVMVPPCCGTPHMVATTVQCAGANYDPNTPTKPSPPVKCSACGATVDKAALVQVCVIPRRKKPAEPGWETEEIPPFLLREGETSRQFMLSMYDTRSDAERAQDPPLPPEFLRPDAPTAPSASVVSATVAPPLR
jgi:hypothetical protein